MSRLGAVERLPGFMNDDIDNGKAPENMMPFESIATLHDRTRRPIFAQGVVAVVVYLAAFCCGLTGGFSGVLLPQLRANSSDLKTDEDMGSWIVSVYAGSASVGCLLSGIIMVLVGRRITVQVAMFSMSAGWLLISLAGSHTLMLLGRALDGFGRGFGVPAFTFHLEEMADPRLRGSLSSCILLAYSIGIMVITMLDSILNWRTVAGLGVAFSVVVFTAYSFLPESPVWLSRTARVDRARKVYNWLWGSGHNVQADEDLQELLKRLMEEKEEHNMERRRATGFDWKKYLKPQLIKSFFIIHVFNLFQVVCGTNIFIFYAMDIVSGLEVDNIDINLIVILTSVVRVVFLVLSCFLSLWFGRRSLCISSGIGSGIAAIIIGITSHMQNVNGWIMISLLLIYVAFNTYGYFVLPPSMVGELLPSKIRCFAGAYVYTFNDIALFGATKMFPWTVKTVGTHGIFWIFGVSSLLCSLFIYLLLPETRGLSLVEVEEYFLQSNILWLTRNKHCKGKGEIGAEQKQYFNIPSEESKI